jgi:biopolymer transport protein ExbD
MISPPENPSTGLKAEVPQPPAKSSAPTPESTIVLQVSRNEVIGWRIRLNQEEANIDDLKDRLRAIYKTRASKVLFVRAESHTEFDMVARVIDITRAADEAIRVGLITDMARNGD